MPDSPQRHREHRSSAGRRPARRIWWVVFGLLVVGVCLGLAFLAFGISSGVQADWDLARIVDPSAYWVVPLWVDLMAALVAFCGFSLGSSFALIRHLKVVPRSAIEVSQ